MEHSNDLKETAHALLASGLTTTETIAADSQDTGLTSSSLTVSQDHDSQGSQVLSSLDASALSTSSNLNPIPTLLSLSSDTNTSPILPATTKVTPTKKQKKESSENAADRVKRQRTGYSPKSIPKSDNELELWKLKLPELREILKQNNMPTTGNKDVLIARIMQHCEADQSKVRQLLIQTFGGKDQGTVLTDSSQDVSDPTKSPPLSSSYSSYGMMGY